MTKQFFYLLIFFSTLLSVNISCSSKNIQPLTEIEIAQQLIKEQMSLEGNNSILPIKIHFSQPGKAITGKPLELEFEISSDIALPYLTIIFQPKEGLALKPRWLVLERQSQTIKLKNIITDKLYRQKITVLPQKKGLLELKVYSISEIENVKKARQQTMYLSIGNPLNKTSIKTIKPSYSLEDE